MKTLLDNRKEEKKKIELANSLLNELQDKFKNSALTVTIGRISKETYSIHFEVDVWDDFVHGGWFNLTDKFTETITSFMEEKGFAANFNNTKSIFWIYLS